MYDPEKIFEFESLTEELAAVFDRLFDFLEGRGCSVDDARAVTHEATEKLNDIVRIYMETEDTGKKKLLKKQAWEIVEIMISFAKEIGEKTR